MIRKLATTLAALFRPADTRKAPRRSTNPLARVRFGGLTLDPRPGR